MARSDYKVNIEGVDNGFIVRVGCKTLVFKDADCGDMIADLSLYLTGGRTVYNEMWKKYFAGEEAQEAQDVAQPRSCGKEDTPRDVLQPAVYPNF